MTSYIALIRRNAGSDYGVDFPDLPGCVTAGRTLDEARQMAGEALSFHLEGMAEDRELLPEPRGLDAVMSEADSRDAVAVLIDVAMPVRSVHIDVVLPEDLVAQIDRRTGNRSGFLAEAAREKLRTT